LPPTEHDTDVRALVARLPELLEHPQRVPMKKLHVARHQVDDHFGRLAAAIVG
jgi:hypothetical protein